MQCVCAILSPVACPALKFFHVISQKARFSGRGEELLNIKCVLIFSKTFSETFLILRRTERDMIENYIDLHVKYTLFLSDFNET